MNAEAFRTTRGDRYDHGYGVLVVGGALGSLALVRDLGRNGVPVAVLADDHPLPGLSRYTKKRLTWPGPLMLDAASELLRLGRRHALEGWLVVPGADADVRLIAREKARLSPFFRVESPGWDSLELLCDKARLYERAQSLGLKIPRTYRAASLDTLSELDCRFPVVIKPAMRLSKNRLTMAKAWRADDRDTLRRLYAAALREMGQDAVVVQELIEGGGEAQFSYAAYWRDGRPVTELTARRTRQFPLDFGHSSTFVETCEVPELAPIAHALLAPLGFSGLVEIEFKRDRRDGGFAILDVNPRPWSWFGLCSAAGVDLAADMLGIKDRGAVSQPRAASWLNVNRDLAAALHAMIRGDIRISDYLRSFRHPVAMSSFAIDDPLPGLVEAPIALSRLIRRLLR
jgi:D-aspartate ligase